MTDLQVIHGAVHDQAGPISTLHPVTAKGRAWLVEAVGWEFAGGFNPTIETEHAGQMIDCAEQDGLAVEVIEGR